jgi:GxxExxY protein
LGLNLGGPIPAPLKGMNHQLLDIDTLTDRVIGCAVEVHRHMEPGLSEGIYTECMTLALAEHELPFTCGVGISVSYKGRFLKKRFELDLLVDNRLIVFCFLPDLL